VDVPDPHYHGKDFWDTPLLRDDSNRASYEVYMVNYGRALREHAVALPKTPELPTSAYEREYKFIIKDLVV